MIRLLLVILLCVFSYSVHAIAGTCGSSADGLGATHTTGLSPWKADSPSYEDVNYCVNTAAGQGDTVNVPSGSSTWSNTLGITKGVILKGAGIDATTITNGGVSYIISIIPSAPAEDPIMQISGFTFDGTDGSCLLIKNENTTYDFTHIRVFSNKFINATTNCYAIYTRGMVFGLIDSNIFNGNFYDINVRGYDYYSWYKYTKDVDNTLVYGSLGMGGARFLYIENNTFSDSKRFVVASGEGARWVFRFNTLEEDFVEGFLDIHGDTNNDGNVAVEIYGNKQTTSVGTSKYGSSMWVDYRGGTAMIYNNSTFVNPSGVRTSIKIREETTPCSALRMGYDMRIHNGYIWNNKNSNNNDNLYLQHHGPITDYDAGNCLIEGVDYWSDVQPDTNTSSSYFSKGLASARPSSCSATVPADVYWETDSLTLYRCTATDTWTAYYTPYTYPHPLRGESASTGGASSRARLRKAN